VFGFGSTIRSKGRGRCVGSGRWRANRHRPRDDRRRRPACDRLINERVRHVNRIEGVRDDTCTRLRESPAFPSYILRAPNSFYLQEFGSTQQLLGAVDKKAHEPLAPIGYLPIAKCPGNALTEWRHSS
jgi:hypothetical protein